MAFELDGNKKFFLLRYRQCIKEETGKPSNMRKKDWEWAKKNYPKWEIWHSEALPINTRRPPLERSRYDYVYSTFDFDANGKNYKLYYYFKKRKAFWK